MTYTLPELHFHLTPVSYQAGPQKLSTCDKESFFADMPEGKRSKCRMFKTI